MCQIAVNFRFFMPFNFGWKAYFSARGWGVELLFFLPAAGAWAFVFLPAAGAWGSAPNLLTKVPAFLKTGELTASNLRFWPISPTKVCCGRGKQELKWGRK